MKVDVSTMSMEEKEALLQDLEAALQENHKQERLHLAQQSIEEYRRTGKSAPIVELLEKMEAVKKQLGNA